MMKGGNEMLTLAKILGEILFALCIWYLMLLYKNNRNKL